MSERRSAETSLQPISGNSGGGRRPFRMHDGLVEKIFPDSETQSEFQDQDRPRESAPQRTKSGFLIDPDAELFQLLNLSFGRFGELVDIEKQKPERGEAFRTVDVLFGHVDEDRQVRKRVTF